MHGQLHVTAAAIITILGYLLIATFKFNCKSDFSMMAKFRYSAVSVVIL